MLVIVSSIISGLFSCLIVLIPILNQNKKDKNAIDNTISESMKCSLRNDILSIYDSCKKTKKITLYQLQAIEYSYKQYKLLGGNSFVDDIMNIVKSYSVED